MFSTDSDMLYFAKGGHEAGWILLVYGNQEAVISDYADNLAMEALLERADALTETYS